MRNNQISLISIILLFLGVNIISSCAIKNDDLIGTIGMKKNIVVYTVCQQKNGFKVKDHYLFKIKDDRITLTERHGDRVSNKFTKDLSKAKVLEELIVNSSDETQKIGSCEYYVKCGIQECALYPDANEITALENLIDLFDDSI